MRGIHFRGATVVAVLFGITGFAGAAAAEAQPIARDEGIAVVEEKIDELQRQLEELRRELAALKEGPAEAAPEPAMQPAEPEDLMAVEPLAPSGTPTSPGPAESLGAPVAAATPARTGNVFNPAISVIGNFLGQTGDDNPFEPRDPLAFDEAEIALEAFIDPYAKAKFFVGVGEEGAELEEGYAEFVQLPWDLTAKVGKTKAAFGKFNLLHTHLWPWADAPLVHRAFFGEEGLADAGVSVSKLIPNRWAFLEATGQVYRGSVEEVFERADRNDLLWVGHLKAYRDLTDSTNLELGGSFASGGLEEGGRSRFSGVDLTYRWRPLSRAIYRSLLARTEMIWNECDDAEGTASGLYASADYQFARRWATGIRLDRVEHPLDPSLTDRGGALTLTFRPSEFSLIRGELRNIDYAAGDDAMELLIQLQFAIGAHGAHPF